MEVVDALNAELDFAHDEAYRVVQARTRLLTVTLECGCAVHVETVLVQLRVQLRNGETGLDLAAHCPVCRAPIDPHAPLRIAPDATPVDVFAPLHTLSDTVAAREAVHGLDPARQVIAYSHHNGCVHADLRALDRAADGAVNEANALSDTLPEAILSVDFNGLHGAWIPEEFRVTPWKLPRHGPRCDADGPLDPGDECACAEARHAEAEKRVAPKDRAALALGLSELLSLLDGELVRAMGLAYGHTWFAHHGFRVHIHREALRLIYACVYGTDDECTPRTAAQGVLVYLAHSLLDEAVDCLGVDARRRYERLWETPFGTSFLRGGGVQMAGREFEEHQLFGEHALVYSTDRVFGRWDALRLPRSWLYRDADSGEWLGGAEPLAPALSLPRVPLPLERQIVRCRAAVCAREGQCRCAGTAART